MSNVKCFAKSFGFLAAFLLAVTACAESISMYTTNGTDGVSGYVKADNVSSFGGTTIDVKNDGPPLDAYVRKGYIRMDISSVNFEVKTAYIDLVVSLSHGVYDDVRPGNYQYIDIYGLTDETLDNWDPSSTDWDNAPANDVDTSAGVEPAQTVYLGTVTITGPTLGVVKRVGGAALADLLNADTNGKVTFILCRQYKSYSNYNFGFAGDNNANYLPPKLTVSTDITTLTGTDGADGRVLANDTGTFNYGSIDMKNNGDVASVYVRKGYMRMDISSIDFTVDAAYIKFIISTVDSHSPQYAGINQVLKVYGLTDESLDDWDPSSTTWNNAPGNDTSSTYAADTNKTVYLGDITVPYDSAAGDAISFASESLSDFLNADTNGKVTLILGRYNSTGQEGEENLIFAGGLSGSNYDPPKLLVFPMISGTIQDGSDAGYFPAGSWHVKNSGLDSTFTRKGYVRMPLPSVDYTIGKAQLDLVLAAVDDVNPYEGYDQTVRVYGLTDQSLDNWNYSTTTWSTAPGNDTESTYAADLTKAAYLGDITVTPSDVPGNVKSLSNQNLNNFLNSDTNGVVTFIFGRYTDEYHGGKENLLFAGEVNTTYAGPSLTFGPAEGTLVLIK